MSRALATTEQKAFELKCCLTSQSNQLTLLNTVYIQLFNRSPQPPNSGEKQKCFHSKVKEKSKEDDACLVLLLHSLVHALSHFSPLTVTFNTPLSVYSCETLWSADSV